MGLSDISAIAVEESAESPYMEQPFFEKEDAQYRAENP